MRPETFDPILLMSVTNGLLPLGKEEILEQLSMLYTGNEENMNGFGSFLLLRTLFNLPSNLEYPVMRIGKPDTDPPNSMERSNRFPILMVEDVPYLVITGYFSTGVPQPVAEHFQFFKEFGQLRTTPFPISTSLSKDELYNQFETEWKTVFGNSELPSTIRTSVTRQINGVLEYSER